MPERSLPDLRAVTRFVVLTIGLIIVSAAARAAAPFPPAFIVAGVPIDATAQNAVAARDSARIQGQRVAFRRLLERLTRQSDWPHLPTLGDDAITDLVQDFDVTNERASGVRYLANYTFRFKVNAVRALLRNADIAESELASKPVVIVPVLNAPEGAKLWGGQNPWRDAWIATSGKGGLVPWIVPAGDADDAAGFDPASPNPDQLAALSQRYGGGDVVVATASVTGAGDQAGLTIAVSRFSPEGGASPVATSVSGRLDAGLYQAGVLAAGRELEEQWKKLSFSAGGTESSEIEVSVPLADARDWAAVEARLAKVPTIEGQEIEWMSHSEVRLRVKIRGDSALFKLALAQQDLDLGAGIPYFVLQLRHRAAE